MMYTTILTSQKCFHYHFTLLLFNIVNAATVVILIVLSSMKTFNSVHIYQSHL